MQEYAAPFKTPISRMGTQNPQFSQIFINESLPYLCFCGGEILIPYARYGGFKGCGILLHAQLSYWGPGKQLLENVFFQSLSIILNIWGVCYFKARRCCVRLPPAGQNPEKRHHLEKMRTNCCVRLPSAGPKPEKWHLFASIQGICRFPFKGFIRKYWISSYVAGFGDFGSVCDIRGL